MTASGSIIENLRRWLQHVAVTHVTIALVLIGLASCYLTSISTTAAGYYRDDGIYLVTARSLAQGEGYRLAHLPDSPEQTKYPVVLPAILAVVWKAAPKFPANVPWMKMVPFLATIGWLIVARQLLARYHGSRVSTAIVLFVAASPASIFYGTSILAESLLALFAVCTLYFLERTGVQAAGLAAVFASLAFNTKTIGIVAILAGGAFLLYRRRYKDLYVFAAICAILCMPWIYWQRTHAPLATINTYDSLNNYYQDWSIWKRPLSEQLAVVSLNVFFVAVSPAHMLGNTPQLIGFAWSTAFTVFGLSGVFHQIRDDGIRPLHLFCGLYLAAVVVWPWPPSRFIWALTPLLLHFVYSGLLRLGSRAAIWVAALSVPILVVALYAQREATIAGQEPTITSGSDQMRWPLFMKAVQAIREKTAPDDTVLGILDPAIYLYSGRKAIRGYNEDPVRLFYSGERVNALGNVEDLLRMISSRNVGWVLDTPAGRFTEGPVLSTLIQQYRSKHDPAGQRTLNVAPGFHLTRVDQALPQIP